MATIGQPDSDSRWYFPAITSNIQDADMGDVDNLSGPDGLVEAVRFVGSSSHVRALEGWINGCAYITPSLVTRDIRTMQVETPYGDKQVQPGDYVVRSDDDTLSVVPAAEFHRFYIGTELA